MIESRNVQAILYFFLIVIVLEGDSRRPRLREQKQTERRDYRPSKWVSNSAMDVWYGNKSMVDILSREFSDIMNRIALRPVRSPLPMGESKTAMRKLNNHNPEEETVNDMGAEGTILNLYNVDEQTLNKMTSIVTKLTEYAEKSKNEVSSDITKVIAQNIKEGNKMVSDVDKENDNSRLQ